MYVLPGSPDFGLFFVPAVKRIPFPGFRLEEHIVCPALFRHHAGGNRQIVHMIVHPVLVVDHAHDAVPVALQHRAGLVEPPHRRCVVLVPYPVEFISERPFCRGVIHIQVDAGGNFPHIAANGEGADHNVAQTAVGRGPVSENAEYDAPGLLNRGGRTRHGKGDRQAAVLRKRPPG